MRLRTPLVAAVLLCGASACAYAQKPKVPVFQASTSLAEVTVLVTGRHGPVTNLKASDFILKDNGHQRPITFFSINDNRQRSAPPSTPSSAAGKVQSNQGAREPGMVVILVDAADSAGGTQYYARQPVFSSVQMFAWAKGRALAYLKKLPSNESVALYGLDSDLHLLANFSSNRAQLTAALKAYRPNVPEYYDTYADPTIGEPGFHNLNAAAALRHELIVRRTQAISTVEALSEIAAQVAGLPGRISLIWLLSHPPLSGALVEAALGRNNRIAVYPVDVRGLLTREGPQPMSGNDDPDDGLSQLEAVRRLDVQPLGQATMLGIAQATGGVAYINSNDIAGAISAAASDSNYSYTLGFYLPANEVNGRFHNLSVKLNRIKHAQLRYQRGFWATNAANPTRSGAAGLLEALRSPVEAAVIPLKADLTLAASGGGLQMSADLGVQALHFTHADGTYNASVVIVTVEQDVQGNVIKGSQHQFNIHCPDSQYANLLRTGLRMTQPVPRLPGAVSLRLMAEDTTTGAVGSLILQLPPSGPHP